MNSSELPLPEKLRWTSPQWQEYVSAWTEGKPVSAALQKACSGLFKEREGCMFINKKLDRSHEVLTYATSLMFRYAIVQTCERLNVHPVDIAFSHDLREHSHLPPFVGTHENPLRVHVLLDKPSYNPDVILQLYERLSHILVDTLQKRGAKVEMYLDLDDVKDYSCGYTSPWRMGSNPDGLRGGMRRSNVMNDNPQVLHAWRSKAPNKFLVGAAASGGLPQRGELYLRWLDGKERPERIAPIDEKAIEDSWPSAMKFFHMWATLGIRERTALRDALLRVEPKNEAIETFDLPDDLNASS